jgi:site-specific recombinase XerD
MKLLRELAEKRPEGPLFVTAEVTPWSSKAASQAMRRLEKKSGVKRLNVYAWRHTFITDCLAKGMPSDVVAELVGNSPRTIVKYYSHLEQRKDALREAARRAVE